MFIQIKFNQIDIKIKFKRKEIRQRLINISSILEDEVINFIKLFFPRTLIQKKKKLLKTLKITIRVQSRASLMMEKRRAGAEFYFFFF